MSSLSFTSLLVLCCLISLSWRKVVGQESFQQQAEREKQFEDKTQADDAQAEENRRSPTGKFLLLKGEIRDDDDSRSDLSLLDKLMPSKTKVIIDTGAAFPFPPPPPPPPPPPMLPPQFILPPPPHAFIPSVIIGPTADFGPLSLLPPPEPKVQEEETAGPLIDPAQFFSAEAGGEQPRPTMENVIRPVSEGPIMQQQDLASQHFQNMMADMQQQQQEWTPGRFRFTQGADLQQESAQRFQGMLPLDMQQEQSASSQRFQGAPFEMQQENRFQSVMVSPMPMVEANTPQSKMEPQQEPSWNGQRFQGEAQQEQANQRFDFGNDAMPQGKMQQQMPASFQMQFPQQEFSAVAGKSNKKNKDKGKQQQQQKIAAAAADMKPEPEPPGCSCGPFFKQSGWGRLKRCAKRCAAHQHHHDHSDHQSE